MNEYKLSIVFSFYNEEENIVELVKKCQKVLNRLIAEENIKTYELVFVNDASTDSSLELLLREREKDDNIKIINMSRNFGVSPCVMAGLQFCTGDAAIYMDSDLQDPPEIIPKMVEAWLKGADVVHTQRRSRQGESRFKLLITSLGYFILNKVISEVELLKETGDFKLISRKALKHLIALNEKRPFVRGLVCWVGFNQTFIEYERFSRFAGKTKFPIISKGVIKNFLNSALISFSEAPLYLSLLLGFGLSLFSFIYLFYVLLQKVLFPTLLPVTPGWTAIIAVILSLGGIQLLTIGILGLYISNIHQEVKKRPNYIVDNTVGF